jgi:protein phosphatase
VSARFALLSDRGCVRENNEDHARAVPERGLYVVADGMGGHVAGEVASAVAVSNFVDTVCARPRPRRISEETELLGEACLSANRAVLREAIARDLHGMGTTLTGLLVRGRSIAVAHVGDSRAYFVKPRELQAITRDHTIVALLVENGVLAAEDAHNHPDRHVLTQALGTNESVEPDVFQLRIPRDARLLLTSDGLHDVLPQGRIHELALTPDLDQAAAALVDAAKQSGGPDNITVLLVEP